MNIQQFNELSDHEKGKILEAAEQHQGEYVFVSLVKICVFVFFVLLVGGMAGCPKYNVWQQGLAGEAELKRAQQNRQITIEEAMALKESAEFKKEAEVIRARGVEEANKIIANGLGGAEGYLRYLYIDALNATNCHTIYIPTEAGLPILEAGKRK